MATSLRGLAGVVPLVFLVACSLTTDPEWARMARVDVDPVMFQEVHDFETDEIVRSETVRDHDDIECLQEAPRRCRVTEYVRATIHNPGEDVIDYYSRCGGPLQHRRAGEWDFFSYPICLLVALPPEKIEPGESRSIDVVVPMEPVGEYRVVVTLGDEDGPLPLSMRASVPFTTVRD